MKSIKYFFKKLFRPLAVLVVTTYARRIYNRGVKAADARHAHEHKTIYLASETFFPDRLTTYDKLRFKTEKKAWGYHARLLTMNTLRAGSFYHTPDRYERNGLDPKEKEIRRRAFIKDRLRMAGLV